MLIMLRLRTALREWRVDSVWQLARIPWGFAIIVVYLATAMVNGGVRHESILLFSLNILPPNIVTKELT
jgi:hypothetical protein